MQALQHCRHEGFPAQHAWHKPRVSQMTIPSIAPCSNNVLLQCPRLPRNSGVVLAFITPHPFVCHQLQRACGLCNTTETESYTVKEPVGFATPPSQWVRLLWHSQHRQPLQSQQQWRAKTYTLELTTTYPSGRRLQ